MSEIAGGKYSEDKGLLVVSFGTTHSGTCEETIGAIEACLAKAMPARRCYRAFTSRFIIKRIRERDSVNIDTVEEAMERMASEGIHDLLVVPTHMIPGGENDKMMAAVESSANLFEEIRVSRPLLDSPEDVKKLAEVIAAELLEKSDTPAGDAEVQGRTADRILVLMGHGSADKPEVNRIYVETEEAFRSLGYDNVYVGTVEGRPSLEDVIAKLRTHEADPGAKREADCEDGAKTEILLAPMMIVAGEHAINDMAGEGDDSWKSRIETIHKVRPVIRGLGSYEGIQKMFLEHGERAERYE